MTKAFKVQGPYSTDDAAFLYWSNTEGWVNFNSATVFFSSELLTLNYPMEATHIAWLDQNGEIVKAVAINDLP